MPNSGAAPPSELIAAGDLVAAGSGSRLAVVMSLSMNESTSTSLAKDKGMEPACDAAGRGVSKGRAAASKMPSHNAQDIGRNGLCVRHLAL
jgi:hypothetical protein